MDICERLTQKAGDLRSAVTPSHRLADLLEDAKAEIERLRAEKRELRAEVDMMLRRLEWLELVDPEDEEFEDD